MILCKQKTAYEMRISDWISDVCSSDLMYQQGVSVGGGPDDELGAQRCTGPTFIFHDDGAAQASAQPVRDGTADYIGRPARGIGNDNPQRRIRPGKGRIRCDSQRGSGRGCSKKPAAMHVYRRNEDAILG